MDIRTSNNNESHCGTTGHGIDCDWKPTSITLDCLHVQDKHTAVNIVSLYSQFADERHTADKIRCNVTYNNMVAAIGLNEFSHLQCVAHCIQLSTVY